jgi:hypothetical protein
MVALGIVSNAAVAPIRIVVGGVAIGIVLMAVALALGRAGAVQVVIVGVSTAAETVGFQGELLIFSGEAVSRDRDSL